MDGSSVRLIGLMVVGFVIGLFVCWVKVKLDARREEKRKVHIPIKRCK